MVIWEHEREGEGENSKEQTSNMCPGESYEKMCEYGSKEI